LVCSPIKAVRELGLERRKTVSDLAVFKFGCMLETLVYLAVLDVVRPFQGRLSEAESLALRKRVKICRAQTISREVLVFKDPSETIRQKSERIKI
jgi:hypothetical protein